MTECVATCKSEGRTQTSCTLSSSPVYFSVLVLCISVCWSCVFLCAALCVHIFLLRVETALRRLAHSMSGLRGYYRTNIETLPLPPLLISSVFLFSRTSGSGDDDEEINGTIHNCRHAIRAKYSYICHHLPPLNITLAMSPLWSQKPRSTVLLQMPASVILLQEWLLCCAAKSRRICHSSHFVLERLLPTYNMLQMIVQHLHPLPYSTVHLLHCMKYMQRHTLNRLPPAATN